MDDVDPVQLRKNQFYMQHPDPSPDSPYPRDYLMHPPSRLAPTSAWIQFRDGTLTPLMAAKPDDRSLPLYAARVEEVLAWRETVPPEYRFWKEDSSAAPGPAVKPAE